MSIELSYHFFSNLYFVEKLGVLSLAFALTSLLRANLLICTYVN